MNVTGKVSGGPDLSRPKLIISAVAAGVLTAVIVLIPALHYTSAHTIYEITEKNSGGKENEIYEKALFYCLRISMCGCIACYALGLFG